MYDSAIFHAQQIFRLCFCIFYIIINYTSNNSRCTARHVQLDRKDFNSLLQSQLYESLLWICLMRMRSCSFHCSSEIVLAHCGMEVSGMVMDAMTDFTSLILVASRSMSERLCGHDQTSNISEEQLC